MATILQHLLRLLLQLPELRQQVFRGRGRLVAVEVFVRQDFVAELRAVLPADDGLGDFPFQERLDVLAVRDVFVVLHVVPVRPFDGEDFRPVAQGRFELLRGVVLRFEDELHGLLFAIRLHAHAEGEVAVVERLLLGEVGGGERLLVRLGDDGGLVVLVGLPEDDA